jgi:hypothetical protein
MSVEVPDDPRFKDAAVLAGIPVLITSFVGAAVLVGAWAAFVLSKLYGWFVVPLGAPPLNWWHIWGFYLIYGLITHKPDNSPPRPLSKTVAFMIYRMIGLALLLLIGWLIHGQI